MKRQTKTIVEYGLPGYMKEVIKALEEGWEIDWDNPPAVYGFAYEAHLSHEGEISEEAKLSQSEILRKARQAKADKAVANKS